MKKTQNLNHFEMFKIHLDIVIRIINILKYHKNIITKSRNFKNVVKNIKSCKSTNFEKRIRLNGYIDHNAKKHKNENILISLLG